MERSKVIGHVYTLFLVLISWVLFRAENLSGAINYIKAMFGIGDRATVGSLATLYLNDNLILYILGIISCLPLIKWSRKIYDMQNEKGKMVLQIAKGIVLGCGFLVAISFLVKGTYNPFIYFNF